MDGRDWIDGKDWIDESDLIEKETGLKNNNINYNR